MLSNRWIPSVKRAFNLALDKSGAWHQICSGIAPQTSSSSLFAKVTSMITWAFREFSRRSLDRNGSRGPRETNSCGRRRNGRRNLWEPLLLILKWDLDISKYVYYRLFVNHSNVQEEATSHSSGEAFAPWAMNKHALPSDSFTIPYNHWSPGFNRRWWPK